MQILRRIPYWAAVALLIYMPFHIFLAQSLSLVTGGLEAWKVAKDAFLALAVLFTICLVWQQWQGDRLFNWLLGLGTLYFVLHLFIWVLNPDIYQQSALLGTIYNTRLPAFLVLGYGAKLVYPGKFAFSSILKIVLTVSTVVAALGVLQYFLPKDILSHAGYSLERGVRPAFFIDDNPAFPRIMSTLREPNALAAYLILPLAALTALLLRAGYEARRRAVIAAAWAVHAAALFLTSSRSGWLGAALAVAVVVGLQHSTQFVRLIRYWWLVVAVFAVCLIGLGFALSDSQFVRSHITHTAPEEVQDLDSNDYHWLLVREGVEGVVDNPLGHGPGTAGLVSIQNPNGPFLTENYYVQIAYEVGVLGLALLVAILVLVYLALSRQRDYIGVIMISAFWAYVATNMLLHTWSNETVAAQWWILAGIVIAGSVASGFPAGGKDRGRDM